MKSAEIMRRKKAKKDASIKYERAISEGNMADARKYAQQTTSMQDGMVDDSKKLLDMFGIPYVDAPSEGEATAAYMTQTGKAYASASQDFDSEQKNWYAILPTVVGERYQIAIRTWMWYQK